MKVRKLTILVAEDDENDRFFLQRAITQLDGNHRVHMVETGAEVIDYLRGQGGYADRTRHPFPSMLLLDIKMPVKSGLEVLRWIRDHQTCSLIPTVMFSSSCLANDVKESFRIGAGGYFTKPNNVEELAKAIELIIEYWSRSDMPEEPAGARC